MTQTIRRELIITIKNVLNEYIATGYSYLGETLPDEITEKLADSILQLRGFSKPKIDLKNSDPAWSILAGEDIDTAANIAAKEATDAFERDFGFGTLPWNSDVTWDKFYKFVVRIYLQDKNVWRDYVAWRNDQGKYTAYSNRKIRENPKAFMDTGYPEFEASKMYVNKPKKDGGSGYYA